ncbi:MAG: glycosyltransferase, partial [Candidatus Omnitrophica bacterium]|nr:glycosyltransferase [Candidatus Omnitrophota bacterium]
IDIVHARSRVPGWIAWLACRRTGTKFVTTCHGYYSQHFFSRVMGWGRKVIVASQAIGRHMVEDFKMPYERMSFIPRGVDLEKFKFRLPQEQEPDKEKIYRIGIIGRLTPIKGHPVFIKAIHRLISCDPNLKIKAFIIGEASGDKEDYFLELKKQVKKLGLDDHLEFSGRKSDIPEVLSELDIMVLATTVPEAFGRVIIEAQAVGVPVIATRVGGVVDVVQDGSNGLLVPPGDDQAIEEAILKLIKDKPLRDSLVQAGRESVEEKFNLNKMAAKILEVYKEVNSSLNILVIKLSALGDVILSIPSIRALREHYPEARISLLTDENGSHIVKGCPYLDEVVIYHKHHGPNKWREIFRLARILSKGWFDISVDLQNNKVSHLTAWLGGIRQRYGYKKGISSKLLTTALDGAKMKIPPVEHQFRILETIGLNIKKHKTKLELWPSVDDQKYIDDFLKESRRSPIF